MIFAVEESTVFNKLVFDLLNLKVFLVGDPLIPNLMQAFPPIR
jgi:hypothetical protein